MKQSPEITTAEIFELARNGDEFSQSIVEQCATPLAYAIHNMALVLNVPLVVMGGSVGTNPMYLSAYARPCKGARIAALPRWARAGWIAMHS